MAGRGLAPGPSRDYLMNSHCNITKSLRKVDSVTKRPKGSSWFLVCGLPQRTAALMWVLPWRSDITALRIDVILEGTGGRTPTL